MPREGKILIIEDEYITALEIKIRLESYGYEIKNIFDNGEDALAYLATNNDVDVVLMDIHLSGQMDGITAATQIAHRFDKPAIFITAYSDDATLDEAKKSLAYGFIKKPIDGDALQLSIEMAISRHQQSIRTHRAADRQTKSEIGMLLKKITIWHLDEMILLDPKEIIYLEICNGIISFRTQDARYQQRGTLAEWTDKLALYGFYRCHKNFLVNMSKVRRISLDIDNSYILRMKNIDDLIPVARNKTSELKSILEL